MPHPPLIILGMHRSGTSLTANWIHECGVNLNPDESFKLSNKKGNYEDTEILRLHNSILKENNLSWDQVNNISEIKITPKHFELAEAIVDKRKTHAPIWGWKEPRTCLFIDNLWNKIVPKAKILVVYRDYNEVVDSLVRREYRRQRHLKRRNFIAKAIHTKVIFPYYRNQLGEKWLNLWIAYNASILRFIDKKATGQYIVCSVEQIKANDAMVLTKVKEQLQMEGLKYYPIKRIYDGSLMNSTQRIEYAYRHSTKTKADEILERLNQLKIRL